MFMTILITYNSKTVKHEVAEREIERKKYIRYIFINRYKWE